jgi:hypothetical protein
MWTQPLTNKLQQRKQMTDTPTPENAAESGLRLTTCSPSSDTPRMDKAAYEATTRTVGKWIVPLAKAQHIERELQNLWEQVRLTIMENLHLADGDVCTLKRLKDAIRFDLDSLENVQREGPPTQISNEENQ